MHVMAKKVHVSIWGGTTNYLCWGLCFDTNIFVSPVPVDIPAGVTNKIDFSGHYSPKHTVGFSIIRYVFFDRDNVSDTVCVNVKYDTRPTGIENTYSKAINTINAYPNPANDYASIVYKAGNGTSASIILRNVLGSVVKNVTLNGTEGKFSLNTNDLTNGIYFYSLVSDGISVSTKKLIIKH